MLRRAFLRGVVALAAWLAQPGRTLAAEAQAPLFPGPARARFARLAAALVPAWNGHAAAGDAEFFARFEGLARATPGRVDAYTRHFGRFLEVLDAEAAGDEAALFERWHAEWRASPVPGFGARFFEMLRRDVLRAYYSTPAGWRSLGFTGPAHRPPPAGAA